MSIRPEFCASCPINHVTSGYVPVFRGTGSELWVGEAAGENEVIFSKPFVGGAGNVLDNMCRNARIDRTKLTIINTIGCHPPENIYPTDDKWTATTREAGRQAVAHCYEHHLRPVVYEREWSRVVALGGHALRAVSPRSGILVWRGSVLPLREALYAPPRVVPTLHPAYLMRNSGLFSVAVRDLQRGTNIPPERYNLWPSLAEVRQFTSTVFAFDLEWDSAGNVTMCGLSDRFYTAMCVPWQGEYLQELKRIFESATVLIGHNIVGADLRFMPKDWRITAELHDTMLKQHLIQPDYRHSLGFVASVFTSKVFWKGTGEETEDDNGSFLANGPQWKTWNSPEAIPRASGGYGGCGSAEEAFRLYNQRDTDAEHQIHFPISNTLKSFGMEDVYWNVSLPVAFVARELGEKGLRIDSSRVGEIRQDLSKKINELEITLPEGLRPYEQPISKLAPAPPNTFKPKTKRCQGGKKYGGKHELCELVFTQPGEKQCGACNRVFESGPMAQVKTVKIQTTEVVVPWNSSAQVLGYAKTIGCAPVLHAKSGAITADKSARKVWSRTHTEFAVVDQLKKWITLRNNFAKPALLAESRVYFNLLVHGTSEGRLSASGHRPGIDPNIQNQPKEIRKIYLPDQPGWAILDIDICQGENMLTAWLAQDLPRLARLQTPGYDEHSDLASRCFQEAITKASCEANPKHAHLRKAAKVINHGKNYGMGWEHMQTNLSLEGFNYSAADVKQMNVEWAIMNEGTAEWQKATVALVKQQGFLCNSFGRKRWFQTRDYATKALAFLPASTLADMVLRMMIAHYPNGIDAASTEIFHRALAGLRLEVTGRIIPNWRMAIQVHDSLVFMGPADTALAQARITHAVMTQPWKELNGFALGADVNWSTDNWGAMKGLKL